VVIPVYDENHVAPHGFRPWLTWSLVGANAIVFIYLATLPAFAFQILAYHFGIVPGFITGAIGVDDAGLIIPPILTLVTYTFFHASWLHLAANMIFLWVFGDDIEAATGHLRFIFFYLVSGLAGGLAHIAYDPTALVPLVGASGAVAGVIGAYLVLHPWANVTMLVLGIVTVRLRALWVIGIWIMWQIANAVWIQPDNQIAYWGHLGGLMTGALLVVVLRRRGVRLFEYLPWRDYVSPPRVP
jgi:membrane associated rhomboid family serine protease